MRKKQNLKNLNKTFLDTQIINTIVTMEVLSEINFWKFFSKIVKLQKIEKNLPGNFGF
jgi:hypothetical protein